MLGAEDAAHAIRLELELHLCLYGFDSGHAPMFAPKGFARVGGTPDPYPDS